MASRSTRLNRTAVAALLGVLALAGCRSVPTPPPPQPTAAPAPATPAPVAPTPEGRRGDEIVVAGQLFHTGTRVITWMDPGGYNAYRTEPRFPLPPPEKGKKPAPFPTKWFDARPGGADLPALQRTVDQFVLHYDQVGLSKTCFAVLHDQRGLSVHFMLDIDGTIYQTLDLKERAWHATSSNSRSVGIEIANIGAYAPGDKKELAAWYHRDAHRQTFVHIPKSEGDPLLRTPGFVGRPARDAVVKGVVQNLPLEQYDYTPEQYAALIKLTAALCQIFPNLVCDYPRDSTGKLIGQKLPDADLAKYRGLLGHFHVQTNKIDPGPAFQWEKVIEGARELLGSKHIDPVEPNKTSRTKK